MDELKKENLELSYKLRELQVELHSALKNYQNTSQLLEQKGNESSRLQRIISDLETKNKRVNEMLGKDMAHRAVNFQSKVEQMLQKPRS
jgi:predicted  nucleic acid-binding Zn-ribbon protein